MNTSDGFNQNNHNWVSAKDVVLRLVDIISNSQFDRLPDIRGQALEKFCGFAATSRRRA